ncbi:hypothetical protein TNCV_168781 [Trichonephila clavipes]|nr:hypothetical protein TNCV_168781 [Trichonephila clavipes]
MRQKSLGTSFLRYGGAKQTKSNREGFLCPTKALGRDDVRRIWPLSERSLFTPTPTTNDGCPVKALDLRSSVGLQGDGRTSIGQVSRIQSSVIVTRGIMKEDTFAEPGSIPIS